MRELTTQELNLVCGGLLKEIFEDINGALNEIGKMGDAYDQAVTAVADMMCRATGNC